MPTFFKLKLKQADKFLMVMKCEETSWVDVNGKIHGITLIAIPYNTSNNDKNSIKIV